MAFGDAVIIISTNQDLRQAGIDNQDFTLIGLKCGGHLVNLNGLAIDQGQVILLAAQNHSLIENAVVQADILIFGEADERDICLWRYLQMVDGFQRQQVSNGDRCRRTEATDRHLTTNHADQPVPKMELTPQRQDGPPNIVPPIAGLVGRHIVQGEGDRGLKIQAINMDGIIRCGHKGHQDRMIDGHARHPAQLMIDVSSQRTDAQWSLNHTNQGRIDRVVAFQARN